MRFRLLRKQLAQTFAHYFTTPDMLPASIGRGVVRKQAAWRLRLVMVCHYRYKNRQCHCLSGSYMACSAKLRKRRPAPQRSTLPRYVVKLHEDDFFDEEGEVLRFDNFDDAVECCADLNIPFFVDADYYSRIITLDSFLVTNGFFIIKTT